MAVKNEKYPNLCSYLDIQKKIVNRGDYNFTIIAFKCKLPKDEGCMYKNHCFCEGEQRKEGV